MKRLICFSVVFLGLVEIAFGYDFQDEVYNQIIKQELDDIETSILFDSDEQLLNVHRRKRDEESVTVLKESSEKSCRKRRWRMCCGEEALERVIDKDRDLKKECYKEVVASANTKNDTTQASSDPFSCEKVTRIKKEWACTILCVGQKKNVIDNHGDFKEKELFDYYKKELTGDEWLYDLIRKSYPKCLEQSKNSTIFVKDKDDPLSCNPIPIKMHHCMWKELQLNCPENKIVDTKICAKIRDRINKNEYIPFRHHQHHDEE